MAKSMRKTARKRAGGGRVLPAVLRVFGALLIAAVIAFCAPVTVPRVFGYEPFEVITGSMEPGIPVGSLVYAKTLSTNELQGVQQGDIIAFYENGGAVVHRVVTNRTSLGEFVTKGDANDSEDLQPIPYDNVVGTVQAHYAHLGTVMRIFSSVAGKVYLVLTLACGVMLLVLAGRVSASRSARAREIDAALESIQMKERAAAANGDAEGGAYGGAIGAGGALTQSAAVSAGHDDAARASGGASQRKRKGSFLKRFVVAVLVVLFVGSAGVIGFTWWQHAESDSVYHDASARYTKPAVEVPIDIDFDALRAVNPDVVGWIYCEDTVINYPVLHGSDNDQYLFHDYTHAYNIDGSIFVDADNKRDFADPNTIIYGHNMDFGAMFHCLQDWSSQEFYEAHPVMWLLTPQKNYRIVLFSGHHEPATSSMYDIIHEPGEQLATLLSTALEKSDFDASTKLGDIQLTQNAHYVMLSTCAYLFDGDRYVLHGQLVPVD